MKVLQINSVCGYGSTGRIAADLSRVLQSHGDEALVLFGRGEAPADVAALRINSDFDIRMHGALSRLSDRQGFYSKKATERLVNEAERFAPDVVHLHNLHGYYLHLPTLFAWLERCGRPVVWTLHDCWAFTGHCAFFDFVGCERWKTECRNCPQKREYPASLLADASSRNFQEKQALFCSAADLTLVTPSQWLGGLVGESFLQKYPVRVIPNGIDLEAFRPVEGLFREKYGLQGKKLALGVASVWEPRKGLDYLKKLPQLLKEEWKVVVVGVTEEQKKELPERVLGITRTNNVQELAEIYTAADVFVNPTLEDNFPTTNLEALACGTPVVTFDTGGSKEALHAACGIAVEKGNLPALAAALPTATQMAAASCRERARRFDRQHCFEEYRKLYQSLLKR